MELAVDQILAERAHHRGGAAAVSLCGAVVLHLLVVAAYITVTRLSPARQQLDFVDVQVVPAAALGAPPPPQPAAKPAPKPEPPSPPPVVAPHAPSLPTPEPKKAKPEPKPAPDNRYDPTTRPKILPPPRDLLAQRLKVEAPPKPAPPVPAPAAPNRVGSANGALSGTAPVGTSIASLENPDFTYDYYIAQLLSSIDQNWVRPPVGDSVHAIVSFHILRDGTISELSVRTTSGFDNFDLSALRAVQNAAPFPPLPRGYHHDYLGVNLTVR